MKLQRCCNIVECGLVLKDTMISIIHWGPVTELTESLEENKRSLQCLYQRLLCTICIFYLCALLCLFL